MAFFIPKIQHKFFKGNILTHYYIIFACVAVALQIFLFVFHRTLVWLLKDLLNKKAIVTLSTLVFVAVNSLIFLTIFRIYPNFRLSAFILAFLLYNSFIGLIIAFILWIFRRSLQRATINRKLRWGYPITLVSLFALSLYNAYTPRILHYSVQLNKPLKPLRIGVASDFHLGKWFGGKQMDELAQIFSMEKVDLILLPGDIMDDNVDAYLAEQMQPHLAKLRAPLGVYATMGNHDLFGDQARIAQEIEKADIRLLQDESLVIQSPQGVFTLIGRNDDLVEKRPSLKTLLTGVETQFPVFVMDHRPTEIREHSQLPVDIQVSGHTHKGQVFPANIFTKMMYELDYGYRQINNGHFFVTSGYGFWGIPLRLGSQSEVVIIEVKGN